MNRFHHFLFSIRQPSKLSIDEQISFYINEIFKFEKKKINQYTNNKKTKENATSFHYAIFFSLYLVISICFQVVDVMARNLFRNSLSLIQRSNSSSFCARSSSMTASRKSTSLAGFAGNTAFESVLI